MNTKLAKRLRKESNYHPGRPRQYTVSNKSRKKGHQGTVILVDSDLRVLYKELKKKNLTVTKQ